MADFLSQNNAKPTRILVRSDTITNWLSSSSTPLMYGEIGIGYDQNGTSVIAKVGSISESTGQKWSDAPQIGATIDSLGLNLENVGRIYSSVVVDANNKPLTTFTSSMFYQYCSSTEIKYLLGDLQDLPYSLRCGTDQLPPSGNVYPYFASASRRNFIVPQYLSGWKDTQSYNPPTSQIPPIFEAPVGFIHPEFDNVLPCGDQIVLNALPIQPIQTPVSVLSWVENVEMWTLPISVLENSEGQYRNDSMKFIGVVSGWFPFPYRQFLCDGDIVNPTSTDERSPLLDCSISLNPKTATNLTGSLGTGSFKVSAQDLNFTCDDYPEYCENNDICGTCMNWRVDSLVEWITIPKVSRDTADCEPSTGTVSYRFNSNSDFNAKERTGRIRVSVRPSSGNEIPTAGSYTDFIFTQSIPECKLVNVSPSSINITSAAQTIDLTVLLNNASCDFTYSTSSNWITLGKGGSNILSAEFTANVSGGTTQTRTGTIIITESSTNGNEIIINVTQAGNVCEVESVDPVSRSFEWDFNDTDGINPISPNFEVDFNFSSEDEVCTWTASIARTEGNFDENWITVKENLNGTGTKTIVYVSSVNPSIQERVSTISVLGTSHEITQNARPCTISSVSLIDGSQIFEQCGSTNVYQVIPYFCGDDQGCVQEETCSWKIDLSELGNSGSGSQYPWLSVVALGYDPNNIDLPPNTIITGTGFVKIAALSTCGQNCTGEGDLRVGQFSVIPITMIDTDVTENIEGTYTTQVQQACGLPPSTEGVCCACDPNNPECSKNPPCFGQELDCLYWGEDEEGGCVCACNEKGELPVDGFCTCCEIVGDQTVCNPCLPPKNCDPNGPDDCEGLNGDAFKFLFGKSTGIGGTIPGITEINVLRYANTFVKIKGYLNPGVSPVWNSALNIWEPKLVPNFYTNEISNLTSDGFVYWDFSDKKWKTTNTIDGGSA